MNFPPHGHNYLPVSRREGIGLEFEVAALIVASSAVSLVLAATAGATVGGLSWLATLLAAGVVVASRPLPTSCFRRLTPLLVLVGLAALSLYWTPELVQGLQVLGQLAVLPLSFALGWRLWMAYPDRLRTLSNIALATMPLAAIVFVVAWFSGQFRFGWLVGNAARPMVIAMSALFVIGTVGRSRRVALSAGAWALLTALASGGRMGFLVILVLIIISPAIGLSWRFRVVLAVAGIVAISAAVQTEAFQDRFFVGQREGTLTDIIFLRGNVNTAGRAENWPRILESCAASPMVGSGVGATESLTLASTNGATLHPHNEFIRFFCDVGLVGSVVFWGFVASAGLRGLRGWWLSRVGGLGAAALQLVFALVAFSLTDNVTIYTSAFMAPAFLYLGVAEAERHHPREQRSESRRLAARI